jgi:hypothetical protein
LLSFVFNQTEFRQFLYFPVLIEHFIEHLQEDKNQTFISYLTTHYAVKINHTHQDHHHDHQKLPFKGQINVPTSMVLNLPNYIDLTFNQGFLLFDKKTFDYSDCLYFSGLINNIWQPPKR